VKMGPEARALGCTETGESGGGGLVGRGADEGHTRFYTFPLSAGMASVC
jgi:hypothetical protein